MKPIVALIGRPNVGKSALFNRLVQKTISIVQDTPGVTRDRVYAETEWNGREFVVVDTGGFETEAKDMSLMVRQQAEHALEEADVVVLVVDVRVGLCDDDRLVAQLIRSVGEKVVIAVNKSDDPRDVLRAAEFYALGLGEPIPVSAVHGSGTGDLLDAIVDRLPERGSAVVTEENIRIAIVGRPNVGKSSLVNALLGHRRMIVSDQPGTTRDAVDVVWRPSADRAFDLIDTAGLRRKTRIGAGVERHSVGRSLRAVDRSEIVLMLLDAREGVLLQDKRIAGYAFRKMKAVLLLVNKWDLIAQHRDAKRVFEDTVRQKIDFLNHAPLQFISATEETGLDQLPDSIERLYAGYTLSVRTSDLNRVVQDALRMAPPPAVGGKRLNVLYGTQVKKAPPTFLFFVNSSRLVPDSYKRYLEDRIRAAFDFAGAPFNLVFKDKE